MGGRLRPRNVPLMTRIKAGGAGVHRGHGGGGGGVTPRALLLSLLFGWTQIPVRISGARHSAFDWHMLTSSGGSAADEGNAARSKTHTLFVDTVTAACLYPLGAKVLAEDSEVN